MQPLQHLPFVRLLVLRCLMRKLPKGCIDYATALPSLFITSEQGYMFAVSDLTSAVDLLLNCRQLCLPLAGNDD